MTPLRPVTTQPCRARAAQLVRHLLAPLAGRLRGGCWAPQQPGTLQQGLVCWQCDGESVHCAFVDKVEKRQ